eukprot:30017-Pelagococcus_subviridis.AAC.32
MSASDAAVAAARVFSLAPPTPAASAGTNEPSAGVTSSPRTGNTPASIVNACTETFAFPSARRGTSASKTATASSSPKAPVGAEVITSSSSAIAAPRSCQFFDLSFAKTGVSASFRCAPATPPPPPPTPPPTPIDIRDDPAAPRLVPREDPRLDPDPRSSKPPKPPADFGEPIGDPREEDGYRPPRGVAEPLLGGNGGGPFSITSRTACFFRSGSPLRSLSNSEPPRRCLWR